MRQSCDWRPEEATIVSPWGCKELRLNVRTCERMRGVPLVGLEASPETAAGITPDASDFESGPETDPRLSSEWNSLDEATRQACSDLIEAATQRLAQRQGR